MDIHYTALHFMLVVENVVSVRINIKYELICNDLYLVIVNKFKTKNVN